ncbi:MAG: hypothetical protein M3032_13085 [Verrucomicrobiota bacterium]|nr:hypothetical protein [Verrucomicrobiota bacterium]
MKAAIHLPFNWQKFVYAVQRVDNIPIAKTGICLHDHRDLPLSPSAATISGDEDTEPDSLGSDSKTHCHPEAA